MFFSEKCSFIFCHCRLPVSINLTSFQETPFFPIYSFGDYFGQDFESFMSNHMYDIFSKINYIAPKAIYNYLTRAPLPSNDLIQILDFQDLFKVKIWGIAL